MRISSTASLIFALATTTGCAALSGLSDLEECSGAACTDASLDSHVGDQGVDTQDTSPTTDSGNATDSAEASVDSSSDTADANDAADAIDALDAADAHDSADTLDTAPDGFDATPCSLACDTTHSLGGKCLGGTCFYDKCKVGFADCDTSGTNINGCETPITTISDCGGCGNTCDTATSTPTACAGGICAYTCKSGFADCDLGSPTDPHDLNGCETPTTSTAHCGGCGACDTKESIGASCSAGTATTCKYSGCAVGFKDCNSTAAPDTDGCETPVTTVTNCGDCGKACDVVKSTPTSCTGSGTCNYTCKTGFVDCNKTGGDLDGCECNGTACCGTGGTTCQPSHSNGPATSGLGNTYYDCAPLGTPGTASTYNSTMAMEACIARTGDPAKCSDGWTCTAGDAGGSDTSVCSEPATGTLTPFCDCWTYTGSMAGHVTIGDSTTTCYCGAPTDPTWN